MKQKNTKPTRRRKAEDADLLAAPGLESLSELTSELLKAQKPEKAPKKQRAN